MASFRHIARAGSSNRLQPRARGLWEPAKTARINYLPYSYVAKRVTYSSKHLVKTYSSDLETTLRGEIVQFAELVPPNVQQLSGNVEVGMYRIIMKPGIRETFSNVEVALRLYLTLLVSNCSGERLSYVSN